MWQAAMNVYHAENRSLTSYPTELADTWCHDYQNGAKKVRYDVDVAKECRHGIGHAVFYVLVAELFGQPLRACTQFRPRSFTLDETILENARSICEHGSNGAEKKNCLNGAEHSYNLYRESDIFIDAR